MVVVLLLLLLGTPASGADGDDGDLLGGSRLPRLQRIERDMARDAGPAEGDPVEDGVGHEEGVGQEEGVGHEDGATLPEVGPDDPDRTEAASDGEADREAVEGNDREPEEQGPRDLEPEDAEPVDRARPRGGAREGARSRPPAGDDDEAR